MKKVILCLLAMLAVAVIPAAANAAQRVAIVFEAPENITKRSMNYNIAAKKAAEIFPAPDYEIIPPEFSIAATSDFCVERGNTHPGTFDAATMQALGMDIACDYIFFIRIERGEWQQETHERKAANAVFGALLGISPVANIADVYCDTAIFAVTPAKAVFTANCKKSFNADDLAAGSEDSGHWGDAYRRTLKSAMKGLSVSADILKKAEL